jgi:hypothetical protein
MTTPDPFAPGYRLTDGNQLNIEVANPQWSTTQSVAATPGGTMLTSVKIVNAVTNITTASVPGAGVTLPQALSGTILLLINSSANDIRVFADGDSTISGLSGLIGVIIAKNSFGFFTAIATKQWAYGNFFETIGSRTGTGSLVCQDSPTINTPTINSGTFNSPSLVTPSLGVATATSINKVILTQPATQATITLADNTTLTTGGNFTTQGNLVFPVNGGAGENGYVLKTDGSGNLAWQINNAANVINVPAGSIAATNVQTALNELDTEKQSTSYSQPGTGAVVRTLTAKVSDFVNGLDFGMVGDGVTDNTTAFNNAVTAAAACNTGTLFIPPGSFLFSSQPNSLPRVKIIGSGSLNTVVIRGYNGTPNVGLFDIIPGTGNGTQISDMAVSASVGTSGGCAFSAIASATFGVSDTLFANMYITPGAATDAFEYVILFNGTNKSTGAIGNRGCRMLNLTVFGASYASVGVFGCISLSWSGGNINTAGGTGTYSGGIQIDGTAAVPSTYILIDVTNINGAINLARCEDVSLRTTAIGSTGGISVWNTADTSGARIRYTTLGGSVQANWVNSGADFA